MEFKKKHPNRKMRNRQYTKLFLYVVSDQAKTVTTDQEF